MGPVGIVRMLSTLVRRDLPPLRMQELGRDYPRIASIGTAKQQAFLVSHPDLVRELLVVQAKAVEKGPALLSAGVLMGEGLLTLRNAPHKPRRRLVNPSFHHSRIAGYAEVMVSATDALDRRWAALRPGTEIDLAQEMSALTLQIVGQALFGADLGEQAEDVYRSLELAMSGWEKTLVPGGERLLQIPLPVFRRMWGAKAALDGVVERLVRRAQEHRGDDVVSGLLESLSEDEVRAEAMTLMLAGHETTANSLTWTWHLLSRSPKVAALLRQEVVGTEPTYAGLRDLPFTTACIAEGMRLYPPAWILEREVTEDLVLDGYVIPRGSIVVASQYALHRDPRWWRDPETFDPTRWLVDGRFDEDAPGQPRGAWFPFGAGTRQCIGESFAWAEAVLVLARLARHWAPQSLRDPKLHAAVTLRPEGGLPARLMAAPH
ncbi:MAG: cytochrome [Frankiales bacterium]|nr:cytochrome [Frankiales bacterium]